MKNKKYKSPPLLDKLYFYMNGISGRDIRYALVGRNRYREQPEKGRFMTSEINNMISRSMVLFNELRPTIPKQPNAGSQRNVTLAAISLAFYRAISEQVPDRSYVIELTTDIMWKAYKKSARLYIFLARLLSKNPQKQLSLIMRCTLYYPFGRPGYDWKVVESNDAFAVDFHYCPPYEYFKGFGEEELDFFRRSWCSLDFPIAEIMAKGGTYTRPHTLSHGDALCNMRFNIAS